MALTIQEHVALVEAAYAAAQGQWTGWDWPASFGAGAEGCAYCETHHLDGEPIEIDNADPDIDEPPAGACGHYLGALDMARDFRVDVRDAAKSAEEYALCAVTSARAGEWSESGKMIESACRCERRYGDDPTWAPVRRAIEEWGDAMAAEAQAGAGDEADQ